MNFQKSWNQTARDFSSKTLESKTDSQTYGAFVSAYEKITHRIDFRPNLRIADLGSGTGYLAGALKGHPCRIVGVDISIESIRAAQKRNDSALFVNGDLLSLPIKEKSVDIAAAITSIEFCFDRKKAILEANKILKPGGKFYMEVRNRDFILLRLVRPFNSLLVALKLVLPYNAENFEDLNINEWREILQNSGFRIEKELSALRPWNYGPFVTRVKNFLIHFIRLTTPLQHHYMSGFVCVKA